MTLTSIEIIEKLHALGFPEAAAAVRDMARDRSKHRAKYRAQKGN